LSSQVDGTADPPFLIAPFSFSVMYFFLIAPPPPPGQSPRYWASFYYILIKLIAPGTHF
jgi:hypothetical protein